MIKTKIKIKVRKANQQYKGMELNFIKGKDFKSTK